VAAVDQRRVLRLRGVDERARVVDADVERDRDDLDALGV
jgi:hypothetical protein